MTNLDYLCLTFRISFSKGNINSTFCNDTTFKGDIKIEEVATATIRGCLQTVAILLNDI